MSSQVALYLYFNLEYFTINQGFRFIFNSQIKESKKAMTQILKLPIKIPTTFFCLSS